MLLQPQLLRSRPRVWAKVLALPVARVLVESLMQPHLTPMVGCLLVSHMSYIPLQSPQVVRGRLWRWWWGICGLLPIIPRLLWCLTLRQPGNAVLLNEGSGDRRSDDLAGGDRDSVKLAEARDQCWKSQCPVGLFWVHMVPRRCPSCKLIDGVSNQLSHVNTHLCQDGIHQLTLW